MTFSWLTATRFAPAIRTPLAFPPVTWTLVTVKSALDQSVSDGNENVAESVSKAGSREKYVTSASPSSPVFTAR